MGRPLLPLLVLLLASGCALGPNYRRPAVSVMDSFRGQSPVEAASLADQPWWEVFGDPALQGLINQSLERNYDVRTAVWRVEEYRARAGIERSDWLPQLTPSAMWERGRISSFSPGGGQTGAIWDVHAALSWELDLWGRIRRLNEAARAQYLGAWEQRRGVYLATAAQVAQAYFELRELDARLEIAKSTTAAFQETYDLFKRRLTGGTASALETTRAEAALATASAFIPNLERQIQAQENLLCFLVGRNPGSIARGADLAQQTLPPRIPAGLPSTLLERRPDLRATEQDLVAANAAVGVATASYLPTLSLTGLFGGLAPEVSQLFGTGKQWMVAPSLAGPSVQGLRLKYQKEVRVAQWEQAKTRYEAVVTSAFGEVSTALTAYEKLAEVEQRQARAVAAYQEAVHLATLRYAAGLSSYVEVLDAQQQLFPAQNTLSQIRLSRLLTVVQLYKALGGGWKLEDPRRVEPAGRR
jgi:outer membrane protein, multidrug efflux system